MDDCPSELLIDLRADASSAAIWSRRLLGLAVVDRAVRAARRAGIGTVKVRHDTGDVSEIPSGAERLTPADIETGIKTPTIVISGNVLCETAWLAAAAAETVTPGEIRSLAPGVILCGAGAQVPSADTARGGNGGADILRLTGDNWPAAEQRLLQSLRKSTDGFMARMFARPLSMFLSKRLARTGITPNAMTVVSLLIGLAAAAFFLSSVWWMQALGGLLFVAHSVVDGCDGELARLKFTESRLGGLLDFWSDNLVHVAVFACMGVGWSWSVGDAWPLWLAGAAVLGTAGSAVTVYGLTMRDKSAAGPVYTSVAPGENGGLTRLLDELSRRDFIYLVFALSLFGKAAWFLVPAAIGAPVFLALVLVAAWRARQS